MVDTTYQSIATKDIEVSRKLKVGAKVGNSAEGAPLVLYDNTSGTTPLLTLEQEGTGDASIKFKLTGGVAYAIGIDNTNDTFNIATNASAVGATDTMMFDSADNIGCGLQPLASARLALSSTTRGFRPTTMTEAQMQAIGSPAAGLIVYNSTSGALCVFNNSVWREVDFKL